MHFTVRKFAILLTLSAMGCGGSGGTSGTPGGNSPEDGSRAIDIKVGGTEVKVGGDAGLKLPADFPSDVPIYRGAIVRMVAVTGAADKAGGMVSLETQEAAEKVAEFYKAELKSQGWTEASSYSQSTPDGKTGWVLGAKKDGRNLALSIADTKENKTIVTITMQGK